MAAEPARPGPVLRNGRGHNSKRPAYRKETTNKQKTIVYLHFYNEQLEMKFKNSQN